MCPDESKSEISPPFLSRASATMSSASSGCGGARILLIDDDPVFRALITRFSACQGLRMDAFASILELEPFSEIEFYDGVILDYHMPDVDGIDLFLHLQPFFSAVPTILISADRAAAPAMEARSPGLFRAFMNKNEGCSRITQKIMEMIFYVKQHA